MLEYGKNVLWRQGLFLQPQHFQTADWNVDCQLRALRQEGDPWPWGFHSLSPRLDSLQNEQVDIPELSAVFPDGTLVRTPGNAILPPRSFSGAWEQIERPFMVYIGLRRLDPAGNNVMDIETREEMTRIDHTAGVKRYVSLYTPEPNPDLHSDGPAAPVRVLDYSLGFYWENEIERMADCEFLPALRLVRIGSEIRPDSEFIPPVLTLSAFPLLRNTVQDVLDQLCGRAARLEEYKPASGRVSGWIRDPQAFSLLLTLLMLNRNIPPLTAVLESNRTRPWSAYLALRQLLAELAGFIPGVSAQGETEYGEKLLPPYNHRDPASCFTAAKRTIIRFLDNLISGPEHLIRLEPIRPGNWKAALPESFFSPGLRYWLLARSAQPVEKIRESVLRRGKLAPFQKLSEILSQAIPGIPLRVQAEPPMGLPHRVDTCHFAIDAASPLWREVNTGAEHALAFFWDGAPEDLVVHVAATRET